MRQFTETHDDFSLIGLTSEQCRVAVVPELGAKILSLCNLRTHREWMWRPPGALRLWKNSEGESFLNSTFVGADECLPTIAPCAWSGRTVPDHGEVWSIPWTLDSDALSKNIIRTTVSLPRSPFFFERSLTINQNKVLLDYRLTNIGSSSEPWLWALHPLLKFEPGDRLELPSRVCELQVYAAQEPDFPRGKLLKWPGPSDGINIPELVLAGENSYLKCFAHPLQEGWARIVNARTNDSLSFRWDLSRNPCLGIWLTRGGFQGWHHPAIEPTNAATDSLAEAAKENDLPTLAPGATQTWCVELSVGASV